MGKQKKRFIKIKADEALKVESEKLDKETLIESGWVGFFDGICEPYKTSGRVGYGAVLLYRGAVIDSVSLMGEGTIHEGVYWGLIALLKLALKAGCNRDLVIFGDSMLVLLQVLGGWRCHQPHLNKLREQVMQLKGGIKPCGLWWIHDSENRADPYSHRALEQFLKKEDSSVQRYFERQRLIKEAHDSGSDLALRLADAMESLEREVQELKQ